MLRYVFDLDGTICSQMQSGTYHLAKPVQQVIDFMAEIYAEGHHITIFTARGMNTYDGDVEAVINAYWNLTVNWLERHGVKYHVLRFGKPPADFYVDDKGIKPWELR